VAHIGEHEQRRQLRPVLPGGLRVGVPAYEPLDELRRMRLSVMVIDDAKAS
jgi:hypothetical protein